MGTRGSIAFILPDGTLKEAYNHYDSYPEGLGAKLQKQLSGVTDLMTLLPQVEALTWVDQHDSPDEKGLAVLKDKGITPSSVSTGKDWYAYLRRYQGNLTATLDLGIIAEGAHFMQDSLFCEWAYLIDFRSGEMVILEGFNTNPGKQAPYCVAVKETPTGRPSDTYYGCVEVWRGSLADFKAIDMTEFEEKLHPERADGN